MAHYSSVVARRRPATEKHLADLAGGPVALGRSLCDERLHGYYLRSEDGDLPLCLTCAEVQRQREAPRPSQAQQTAAVALYDRIWQEDVYER